jgi:hypothetical protein
MNVFEQHKCSLFVVFVFVVVVVVVVVVVAAYVVEQFYNYRNVSAALRLMIDNEGLSFSKRKITVSTSGIAPIIPRFGRDFYGMNLAISLHAVTDDLRSYIISFFSLVQFGSFFVMDQRFHFSVIFSN